jgi:hypothetical protein
VVNAKRGWPAILGKCVAGLAVAVAIVAGAIAVGNAARDSLGPHERYSVAFVEIDCPIPDGMNPTVFLNEVQYTDQLPDRVSTLDPNLADRLRAAFAKHPRVAEVQKIEIGPGKRIRVNLTLR